MTSDSDDRLLSDFWFSLVSWGLNDIKKAATAEVDLPRLAFVGLKDWIDTVARIYSGLRYEPAWQAFVAKYVTHRTPDDVTLLYKGMRNPMTHEYGTDGVALMHNHKSDHWTERDGIRLIDLGGLMDEFEAGFLSLYEDLKADSDLRRVVLPRTLGLLKPVRFGAQAASGTAPQEALSASFSTSLTTLAASATAGPDVSMYRFEDEEKATADELRSPPTLPKGEVDRSD